jgi:hypothetical protein
MPGVAVHKYVLSLDRGGLLEPQELDLGDNFVPSALAGTRDTER